MRTKAVSTALWIVVAMLVPGVGRIALAEDGKPYPPVPVDAREPMARSPLDAVPTAEPREPAKPEPKPDPSKTEVPLPALAGWNGTLIYDNAGVGVWTTRSTKVFPDFGTPEVIGLDDKGRLTVAYSYSGKWYRQDTVTDGRWLGGLEVMDLDPRRPGTEIYTGGQNGNLYQIIAHRPGLYSEIVLASLPGKEIHTLLGGDLIPERPGMEMVMFTMPAAMYLVTPDDGPGVGFKVVELEAIHGRIRDALLLPRQEGDRPTIATASRNGEVALLHFDGGGKAQWRTILQRPMGMGRIALRKPAPGEPTVIYAGCDDGILMRLERGNGDAWKSEMIYAGPQGIRGVVAGRFDADPKKETVAVYGYSEKVQVVTRNGDRWTAESIFKDIDKGHWLAGAEVDGRNGTDEILACGFGGRLVLLSRPPGYGLPGVAVDPDEKNPR
jgi:hypothetical protein